MSKLMCELSTTPEQHQKSFYGKAFILMDDKTMTTTLFSYDTKIMTKYQDGHYERHYERHYDNWTQTTGKHIKAFSGMSKAEFLKLTYKE